MAKRVKSAPSAYEGNNMSNEDVGMWPVEYKRAMIRETDADTEGAGSVGPLFDSAEGFHEVAQPRVKAQKRPRPVSDF